MTANREVTRFEDLNNDLLLEIFDYLTFNEILTSFYRLKRCLDRCIRLYPALEMDLDRSLLRRIAGDSFQCRSLTVSSLRPTNIKELSRTKICLLYTSPSPRD